MFSLFLKLFAKSKPEHNVAFCVVGIGNIGSRYSNTRHNVGFMVVDALNEQFKPLATARECHAETTIIEPVAGIQVITVKPDTFVNRSGQAVSQILDKYKCTPQQCLVVVDDFNLKLGTVRLRKQGTHGGHNGLKSIIQDIGDNFARLRLGIGPLSAGMTVTDFVLGEFDPEQEMSKNAAVENATKAVVAYLDKGIEIAMSQFNK